MNELLEDYLGWKYIGMASYILLTIWMAVIFFAQWYFKKKNKKKNTIAKKWWFWAGNVFLVFHFVFVDIINPSFMGYGTPEYFTHMYIREDKIVLFDDKVTYYDDDNSSTDDYTGHLRIHVVDRATRSKLYSELIGSNYSCFVDSSGFFMLDNSQYYHGADNTIRNIYSYDIETKKMEKVVKNGGDISVDSKKIHVHSLYVTNAIYAESDQAEVYILNTATKKFQWYDGKPLVYPEKPKTVNFSLRATANSSDRKELYVESFQTEHTYLLPTIATTYYHEGTSYVLVKYYTDLNKTTFKYAMVNSAGEQLWEVDMNTFEKEMQTSGLDDIQNMEFDGDLCYFTLDPFLVEMDLYTGKINWWVKI